ncbi:response regulator transcription factor [Aquiflexum sp. LQ15W]|uniref:response regulator n=1 Tax=Cognataquiflexum nitidum TaxID=2922272 RepID=UPI001F12CBA4|nr:response regulator transcription factor [Cognataquiflexum nitidum]MCH6200404.1 response regulator transcription factor [Cognataquiflexum nitidum]
MRQKVFIADDHPLFPKGLKGFLEENNFDVIGEAPNGDLALKFIQEIEPNLAFLDLDMPGMSGLEVAKMCYESEIQTKIILLTFHKKSYIYHKPKSLNISGYVHKAFAVEELLDCIEMVSKKGTYLSTRILSEKTGLKFAEKPLKPTPSEIKIIRFIADGLTTKEIANTLFVAERTIDKHRSNIVKKLDLDKKHN